MPFEGEMYPEATVLATTSFPFEDHLADLSYVNYCWTPRGSFAMLRIPGLWRCNLYYDPAYSLEEAVSEANVQAQLSDIVSIDGPFDVVDRRPYRVHQRMSGRALARAPLGGGFPASSFRFARWVHISTLDHVSSRPP